MYSECYVGSTCINIISYADDMVLLSPSVGVLAQLLETCEANGVAHGLEYIPKKGEVMVFLERVKLNCSMFLLLC